MPKPTVKGQGDMLTTGPRVNAESLTIHYVLPVSGLSFLLALLSACLGQGRSAFCLFGEFHFSAFC